MVEIIVSLSISGAALMLSVLSPVITAAINSRSQKAEREQLFYIQHRADVFEQYVHDAGRLIKWQTDDTVESYGSSLGKILLYVDQDLANEIMALDERIFSEDTNDYEKSHRLSGICYSLQEKFPRLIEKKGKRKNK